VISNLILQLLLNEKLQQTIIAYFSASHSLAAISILALTGAISLVDGSDSSTRRLPAAFNCCTNVESVNIQMLMIII
jgi:hypothetical protein